MLHGVIMAGGSGTRFWPASRQQRPKQLLTLDGNRSLLQATLDRCQPWIPPERMWVVTGESLAEETARQLPEVPKSQILSEPCGRNTAPCVGLAAACLAARDPDATMLVLPADHAIQTARQFQDGVAAAVELVNSDPRRLVLFGVRPSYPATGYGYIERAEPLNSSTNLTNSTNSTNFMKASPMAEPPRSATAFGVRAFREKPSAEVAAAFLQTGQYYWNCGIFCWRAARILEGLARFEPQLHAGLSSLATAFDTAGWEAELRERFPEFKSISIDYAVLEHDRDLCVLEAPFGWDDVGSWAALPRLRGVDADGNTVDGLHVGSDTRDCVIRAAEGHLVATVGVRELVIVHTADATLVARRGDDDGLKKLVHSLGARGLAAFQ
jgi:mannose-1-phosphate guanylyltransferase